MYWFSRGFGVLVIGLALILPSLAQDGKKDPAKPGADKKTDKAAAGDKKAEKPGDKKTDPKKAGKTAKGKSKEPKEEAAPEEKVVYGQTVSNVKLKQLDANSQKDFTIELMLPNPELIVQVEQWKAQQLLAISRQTNFAQRQQSLLQYQMQLAQKTVLSPKDFQVRAADGIKVRSYYPPTEYDDKGNPKRWTAKELKALKGKSKLPGYPVEYDALRPGQIVDVYLAKKALPTRNTKTKGLKVEDPVDMDERPEVVMIVIKRDVLPGQR